MQPIALSMPLAARFGMGIAAPAPASCRGRRPLVGERLSAVRLHVARGLVRVGRRGATIMMVAARRGCAAAERSADRLKGSAARLRKLDGRKDLPRGRGSGRSTTRPLLTAEPAAVAAKAAAHCGVARGHGRQVARRARFARVGDPGLRRALRGCRRGGLTQRQQPRRRSPATSAAHPLFFYLLLAVTDLRQGSYARALVLHCAGSAALRRGDGRRKAVG
eukprot:gene11861-biopygen2990